MIAWLSIKYNERNRNIYLGKVCTQMYTMKSRANGPTFSKNERKCAATACSNPFLLYLWFCNFFVNFIHLLNYFFVHMFASVYMFSSNILILIHFNVFSNKTKQRKESIINVNL